MLKATAILLAFTVWAALFLLFELNHSMLPKAQEIVVKTGVTYMAPPPESFYIPVAKVLGSLWALVGGFLILPLTVVLLFLVKVRDTWVLLFLSILLFLLVELAGGIGVLVIFRLVNIAAGI